MIVLRKQHRFIMYKANRNVCTSSSQASISSSSLPVSLAESLKRDGFGSFHSADVEFLIRQTDQLSISKMLPNIYADLEFQCEKRVQKMILESSLSMVDLQKTIAAENIPSTLLSQPLFPDLFFINKSKNRHVSGSNSSTSFTFLNHGAFGEALTPILMASNMFREYCEEQPLRFFDRELFLLVVHALHYFSQVLCCPSNELFPLVNVTAGMNCVLHSLLSQAIQQRRPTVVLYLSLTYGSTKKIVHHTVERYNRLSSGIPVNEPLIRYQVVDISLPIGDPQTDIVDAIANNLTSDSSAQYIVILDSITSNTAMALPVRDIARACRSVQKDAVIVVDAAHSLFAQEIQLYNPNPNLAQNTDGASLGTPNEKTTLDTQDNVDDLSSLIDFYVTNGHKWFCNNKGSAVLWAHPRHHRILQPGVISHGYVAPTSSVIPAPDKDSEDGNHNQEKVVRVLSGFIWDGCRDYTSFICSPMLSKMWSQINQSMSVPPQKCQEHSQQGQGQGHSITNPSPVGLDVNNIRARNHGLLMAARSLLMSQWGLTERDMPYPLGVLTDTSPMTLIPVPSALHAQMSKALGTATTTTTFSDDFEIRSTDAINNCGEWSDHYSFALQEWLYHHASIEVPVKSINGKGYFRISAHLYNSLSDYHRLGEVVSSLCSGMAK